MIQLDHVLVGAPELEAGRDAIEGLCGVRRAVGGSHPRWGSHNALLALGPACYLELVALRPGAPGGGPFEFLRGLEDVRPIGWAVATSDLAGTRATLEGAGFDLGPNVEGERRTPDGRSLEWVTFGLAERTLVGTLPFFIEWSPRSLHPALDSPAGCLLERLRLEDPEHERLLVLREVLGLAAPVELAPAAAAGLTIELATPRGPVRLSG